MKDMHKKSLLHAKLLNREMERLKTWKNIYVSNQRRSTPVINEERLFRMKCYKKAVKSKK
jgi:hypothetical protein